MLSNQTALLLLQQNGNKRNPSRLDMETPFLSADTGVEDYITIEEEDDDDNHRKTCGNRCKATCARIEPYRQTITGVVIVVSAIFMLAIVGLTIAVLVLVVQQQEDTTLVVENLDTTVKLQWALIALSGAELLALLYLIFRSFRRK